MSSRDRRLVWFIRSCALAGFIFLLAACAPAGTPAPAAEAPKARLEETQTAAVPSEALPSAAPPPASTQSAAIPENTQKAAPTPAPTMPAAPVLETSPRPTPSSALTLAPTPSSGIIPPATSLAPQPAPEDLTEEHTVQVEWPPSLRLGDSDIVHLALAPSEGGYILTTEFPEHRTLTETVNIQRPDGYRLSAVARLDGAGFDLAPQGDVEQTLPVDEGVIWRWTLTPRNAGQQRLAITLRLRWTPAADSALPGRETTIFSRSLEVKVLSFFGLRRGEAFMVGFLGLFLGGGLGIFALAAFQPQKARQALRLTAPNPRLSIELPPGLSLQPQERSLLKSLFHSYARLLVEQEFLSGYSGARTLLAQPILADGRANAPTIAKLGEVEAIGREFENYERFVKDRLPPITARIQHPPVIAPENGRGQHEARLAALQYTFIGAPGSPPTSLRQALLAEPEARLLYKLYDTFGPSWWMQHKPYTFRLAIEYDRVLPAHLMLEPALGKGRKLDGRTPPSSLDLQVGELVTLHNFARAELRRDGRSLSLRGVATEGQPELRVRWMSLEKPEGATGRVAATRQTLLKHYCSGCQLYGLPDPFNRLQNLLAETVSGSQSTIHGDLNLENVLVGPGDLVWLIDFAQTREGHTLFDFAHLEAEIIAHILAPKMASPEAYLEMLCNPAASPYGELYKLLEAVHDLAARCLFNPSEPREYQMARTLACLGALKYSNLDERARQFLVITAAQGLSST